MQSAVKKIAVICNGCFWVTIGLKYWKYTQQMPVDFLNTIIILGTVALFANLIWLAFVFFQKRNTPEKEEQFPQKNVFSEKLLVGFNLVSLLGQFIYIFLNYY